MSDTVWFELPREVTLEQQWDRLGAALATVMVLLVLGVVLYVTPGPPGIPTPIFVLTDLAVFVLGGAASYGGFRALQSRATVLRRIGVSAESIEAETTRGRRYRWQWSDPTLELVVCDFAFVDRGTRSRRWSDLPSHDFRLLIRGRLNRLLRWRINLPVARELFRRAHELRVPISAGTYSGGGEGSGYIANRIGRKIAPPSWISPDELDRLMQVPTP